MNLHIEDPIPGVTHVWEQLLPMSPGHTLREGIPALLRRGMEFTAWFSNTPQSPPELGGVPFAKRRRGGLFKDEQYRLIRCHLAGSPFDGWLSSIG